MGFQRPITFRKLRTPTTTPGRDAPLRVLDVNNFYSPTGGGVRRYHQEKIRHLGGMKGVEYHLVVPSDREARIEQDGATLHHVPAVALGGSGYRFIVDARALRRLILAVRPDVIEIGSPYVLPDLVRHAARGTGARLIGFWHAHFPDAYMRRPLAAAPEVAGLAERLGWWWARRTFGRLDHVVAAAGCLGGELGARGIDRVAIAPLGVDLELFSPSRRDPALREQWGAGKEDVVLAFPHRLCEEKRLSTLIEAFHRVIAVAGSRVRLVFAGHGPGAPEVAALCARYPNQVFHAGFLQEREDVARLLASVDIVAALSPTETFGLSAAEAMASGVALIGSRELSVGEMLEQSRAGIAVADRDPQQLADAWIRLLEPGRASKLGVRAHAYALARFDWSDTFDRLVEIYHAVVEGKTVPELAPWSGALAALATASGEHEGAPTPSTRFPAGGPISRYARARRQES